MGGDGQVTMGQTVIKHNASKIRILADGRVLAGFAGSTAEAALAKADEIGQLEHKADKVQDRCAKTLFRSEGELSPVAIFMWTKLLNKIGDIANHAENVGDQFRLFVAAS